MVDKLKGQIEGKELEELGVTILGCDQNWPPRCKDFVVQKEKDFGAYKAL